MQTGTNHHEVDPSPPRYRRPPRQVPQHLCIRLTARIALFAWWWNTVLPRL